MPVENIDGRLRFVTQGVTLEDYICTAMAVVVFYDYFLTLSLEIQNIWQKPFRFPTLIFLLNRYLCIALSIALVCPNDTRDYGFQIVFGTLLSLTLVSFFALRTYALWGCNRVIFGIVIMAYIPGFSLNLCTMLLKDVPTSLGINALVPLCFILFDILVLSLSLVALRNSHGSHEIGTLYAFFVNHGILYFVLLSLLNIPQIIVTHIVNQPLNAGVMYTFSSVLVSRFMLRLGRHRDHPPPTEDLKRWCSPTREMIVGNLAEPLVPLYPPTDSGHSM